MNAPNSVSKGPRFFAGRGDVFTSPERAAPRPRGRGVGHQVHHGDGRVGRERGRLLPRARALLHLRLRPGLECGQRRGERDVYAAARGARPRRAAVAHGPGRGACAPDEEEEGSVPRDAAFLGATAARARARGRVVTRKRRSSSSTRGREKGGPFSRGRSGSCAWSARAERCDGARPIRYFPGNVSERCRFFCSQKSDPARALDSRRNPGTIFRNDESSIAVFVKTHTERSFGLPIAPTAGVRVDTLINHTRTTPRRTNHAS